MQFVIMIGGLLLVSYLMSTKQDRSEASKRLARWNKPLMIINIILLALLFYPW